MWDQKTQVEDIKTKVKKQRDLEKNANQTLDQSRIQQALSATDIDLDVDLDNAKLSEVQAHSDALNANIANMIAALDDTTVGINQNFSLMRNKTGFESFVGVFSSKKSEEMRSKRISESDISSNLNDLIIQSEGILTVLQEQYQHLSVELTKGNDNLEKTIKIRQIAVEDLEQVKAKMSELDPIIMDLESQIDNETNPAARTKLEDQLAEKDRELQNFKNEQATLLANSQTLESYIEQNKVHVRSLGEQRTAQQVLIEKLKTDTAQRVVLYKQYEVSLKTAQQQETAHQLNEIGTKVDKATMIGIAQIGSGASNRLADMLESHLTDMQDLGKISARQQSANERFKRRFGEALDKHDSANYSN